MSIKETALWILGFIIAYAVLGKLFWVGAGILALLWLIRYCADWYWELKDRGKFE